MSETANRYSLEVRADAVRMVLDGTGQHESRGSTAPQGLMPYCPARDDCVDCIEDQLRASDAGRTVKKVEIDTGQRGSVTTERTQRSEPCQPLVGGQWRAPLSVIWVMCMRCMNASRW